jgi:hypothetical protein
MKGQGNWDMLTAVWMQVDVEAGIAEGEGSGGNLLSELDGDGYQNG